MESRALYALCADADRGALGDGTWPRLITSAGFPAARFAFERCDDATP